MQEAKARQCDPHGQLAGICDFDGQKRDTDVPYVFYFDVRAGRWSFVFSSPERARAVTVSGTPGLS